MKTKGEQMETTYNKYKRQREELMKILGIEMQRFIVDQSDIQARISYLKKCMMLYGQRKGVTK